ncbi:MAG: hypothetical protein FD153_219 [Rhodospirillaceae bacterium]|nr:MAG: hypothetical protein FD153_219 [Rhodospirillaceae bacterium]
MEQKFERERLSGLAMYQPLLPDHPAAFFQQAGSYPQVGTIVA